MAGDDSLSGFFFNVEKWFGSMAGQRMSFSEKGVYLVMLFQQWRDKQRNLPDDPQAVAELIAVTPAQALEVAAAWDIVRRKFVTSKHDATRIYNIEIETTRQKQRLNFRNKQAAGRIGGKASSGKRQTTRKLPINDCLTTVEQPLTVVEQPSTVVNRLDQIRLEKTGSDQKREEPPDARSKHPIYKSDRFVVFDWQLEDLGRMLGSQLDAFDIHAFFDQLTQQSRDSGLVIPSDRDARWKWLQAEVEAEAKRRGLPMATVATEPTNKRIAGLVAGGQAFLNRGQK